MTGLSIHHIAIIIIPPQLIPFPALRKIPTPIILPIVACVVDIGNPKAEERINQIAVEINMVITIAIVIFDIKW